MKINEEITIVSCSGAGNTGKYSDEVARKLMQSGYAKMLCLARFSVDKAFAEKSRNEISKLIVLDGCPINCAELTVKNAGITDYTHINTTDFGIVKGKTSVTDDKINEIVEFINSI